MYLGWGGVYVGWGRVLRTRVLVPYKVTQEVDYRPERWYTAEMCYTENWFNEERCGIPKREGYIPERYGIPERGGTEERGGIPKGERGFIPKRKVVNRREV